MKQLYDMLIIGGGPGGYTAALYAARAGLDSLVLERLSAGGQMAQTNQVDNYPGFPEGIDGFLLAEKMQAQAQHFGAKTELADVYSLKLNGPIKEAVTSEGIFQAKTIVIATGANPKLLGVPGEQAFTGRGVHYCAACDGMFYRGKSVAVIGGGNSAVADALLLSRVAKEVIIIHRRDTLRATQIYHKPLMEAANVAFRWNSAVTAMEGDGRISHIVVENLTDHSQEKLAVDGVFISIGRSPANSLVQGQLVLDEAGYIVADESTQSSIPGVYAVGDVRTKALRQIVTAVSDGAMAVHAAEEYLSGF